MIRRLICVLFLRHDTAEGIQIISNDGHSVTLWECCYCKHLWFTKP